MKVWSVKLNKRMLVFGIIALLAIVLVIIIATSGSSVTPTPKPDDTSAPKNLEADTEEQRMAFIQQYGWTVKEEAPEVMNLYIPRNFDTVLERYNAIQKRQGFDLEKYKGERVQRYTYIITNYPASVETVFINLIIANGKVIGGDVCSQELGGFMHGFALERTTELSSLDTSVGLTDGTASETDFSTVDADAWPKE